MLKKILFFSLLVFFTLSILANVKNWHILLYLQIAIPLIFLLLAWLDREYALYFLLVEMVLGGAGRWLVYNYGLSIRVIILVFFFLVWWFRLRDKKDYFKKVKSDCWRRWAIILGVGFPLVFGFLMNFIYPKQLGFLLDDANGWLFYLILLPILEIINSREKLWRLIKVFLSSVSILALVVAIFYFLSLNDWFNIYFLQYWFLSKMNYGGKIGLMPDGVYRLFVSGSIFLPTALFILTALTGKKFVWPLTAANNKLKFILIIFLIYLALIASYTRGLWLGTLLALVFFLFWVPLKTKLKIILVTVLFLGFSKLLFLKSFDQGFIDVFLGRLTSVVDSSRDPVSVPQRLSQIRILGMQILEHPLMGAGFGFVIWGLFVLKILFGYLRILWFNFSLAPSDRVLALGSLAGLIAFLLAAGTSPFITSGFGVTQILLAVAVLVKLDTK